MDLMLGQSKQENTKKIIDQVLSSEKIKKKIDAGSFFEYDFTFCIKLTDVKVEENAFTVYIFKSNQFINYNCTTRAFYGDYNEIIN